MQNPKTGVTMETQVAYQKPRLWSWLIYALLLLIPIYFIFAYWILSSALRYQLIYQSQQYLGGKKFEAIDMVFTLLYQRWSSPEEILTQLKLPQDVRKLEGIVQDYPEVAEIGWIKPGSDYSPLYSAIGNKFVLDTFKQILPAVFDTTRLTNTRLGIYPDSSRIFKFRSAFKKVGGTNYCFTFCRRSENILIVAVNMDNMRALLPEIIETGWKKQNRRLYEEYYSPYKGGYSVEIKFTDEKGDNFYTLGEPYGEAWGNTMPYNFGSWKIAFQLYTNDKEKLDWAKKAKWGEEYNAKAILRTIYPLKSMLFLIIAVISVVVLGHLSPKLHGFKLQKKDEN